MNADDTNYWGLLTKDYKVNYQRTTVIKELDGWKLISRSHKHPVHGLCTASIWVKEQEK
jgi:hypothetical protein